MKTTSIKNNIIMSTLYQILILITPFITAPYISRVLNADGIGIYSYTNSIQSYFAMFAALGTVAYGTRVIARIRNDEKQRSKAFWEIEILTVITSSISLLFWGMLIIFSKEYKIYYLILTLNLLNTMFDISWFYTGLEQLKYQVAQNAIFKILGIVLLFAFIKGPNDLILYITLTCLVNLIGTMSMWIYLPKLLKKVSIKELKILPHFKETLIYFIPTIATSIYTVLDKTLIGLITNDNKENGYYEQATKIINMMKTLTFVSLNTVLGARISYLFVDNKIEEIKQKINTSINYILFMGFGIMFGLLGVADRFVPLFFGQGYDEVIGLIKVLSPLVIIIGVSNCLGAQYYTPAGLRAKSTKFIIVGSCVNLILNLSLIPRFKSYGASIATIIAELTISVFYLKYCDGFLIARKLIQFGWKKFLAGLVMFVGVSLISLNSLNDFSVLVMQVFAGIGIYGMVLIFLKDKFVIDILENQILRKLKGNKEGR